MLHRVGASIQIFWHFFHMSQFSSCLAVAIYLRIMSLLSICAFSPYLPIYVCSLWKFMLSYFPALNPAGLYISNKKFISVYLNKGSSFSLDDICLTAYADTVDHQKVTSVDNFGKF